MNYPEFQKMRLSLKSCIFCLPFGGRRKKKKEKEVEIRRGERKQKKKNEFGPLSHWIVIHGLAWWMPPSRQEPSWNLVYACNLCGEISILGHLPARLFLLLQWEQYFQVRRRLQLQNWQLKFYFNIFSLYSSSMPFFLHHICGKRINLFMAVWNKFILIWNKLKILAGASLVAQWLRICLLMQGTRVRALVWEDLTCRRATGPVSHNYWACASGACAPQQERPQQWEARAPRWRVALACRT